MANRMSRRNFMKVGAAAATVLAANPRLISSNIGKSVFAQEYASHITIGNTSIQPNLNPWYFTYFQSRQIYDTLIGVDADGNLVPELATEWQRVDPTTLEVKLRDDVFFSNGEQMTANSVKFSMDFLLTEAVANPGLYGIPLNDLALFPPMFSLFDQNSVEVIDNTNLVIRTTRPDAILEKRFSRFWVMSEQFVTANNNELTTAAAGTGYFQVAEFVPGQLIEYEKFEGNWRGDYPLQSATYVQVGDLRTALESGDIDIAQNLPPDIARTMADSGDFKVSVKSSLATEFVSLIPENNEAFADPRVRRAFNLAIDKDLYNEVARGGFGRVPTGQFLQPGVPGYNEDLESFPYDPAEAMRLLDEAGYRNLEVTMSAANTIRADAEVVAGFLEAIGVRVTLETPDNGTLISEIRAGTDKDMILWSAFYTTLSDWSQAMVGLINPAPGSQRHFENDEFYAVHQQIGMAPDEETRNGLIREAARIMYEDASVLFLSWTDTFFVHTNAIEEVPFNLDNSPVIYAIQKST